MECRPRKPFRWPAALTEVLLLPMLWVSVADASTFKVTVTADTPTPAANSHAIDGASALSIDPVGTMAAIGGTDLYLETTLNGTDRGLAHFGYRDGQLWATLATLQQLGFKLPTDTPSPIRLASLSGVQVHYDREQQSVTLQAPLEMLRLDTQMIDTRAMRVPKASASPGLLLNYNVYGTQTTQGNDSVSAYTELRAFNAAGVLSSTALTQSARTNGHWRTHSVRLDSTWSLSFPESMVTVNVGDTLTGATSWSRATRIGGIQIGSNFALQPYNVTTPLPEFFGSATLPSQVQLYINGMKQYSGKVPAGPFQLNAVPGINGAGNAQVLLTNALGQVTTLNFSLYGTQRLLRQGLTDWSAELGFVREDYGLKSFSYSGEPMASGTWRHGFSNSFTGEAHAEATNGLLDAGVGGDWLLGSAGVVSASAARSTYNGRSGSRLGLGYSWTNSRYNVALNGIRASSGYRDVASLSDGPPPRLSASAQAGINVHRLGSFGLGYTRLDYLHQITRYVSAYWFKSLGRRATLSFNLNQNLDQSRDRSVFLTFSMSLDDRTYGSTSLQHAGNRNTLAVDATRSIPTEGGVGWRAQLQQGGDVHGGLAELDYLGRYGQVQAGVSDLAGNSYTYANATGSVVLMGGGVFPSRSIYNGFAVVSTDGVPNVPVKLENNLIGSTNSRGLLLVTPLNAYQNNKVSIDPMDLPPDMRLGKVDLDATPTDRAGTLVRFDITRIRAASIILHDAAGKPLPLGSQVRVRGQHGEPALVGFDGVVYLDTLQAHDVLDVTTPEGSCHVAFDYHNQGDGIPQIGPLTCGGETSP
jgi:outer membrane usher protein